MRIISNFHDFYDSLMAPADTQIWVRRTSRFQVTDQWLYQSGIAETDWEGTFAYWERSGKNWKGHYSLLIFCGELIPFWQQGELVGFSAESCIQEFQRCMGRTFQEENTGLESFFALDFPGGEARGLNFKYRVPIVLAECSDGKFWLTLNPCLNDLKFYRYYDLTQTFQELERFLFNDLPELDRIPNDLDDRYKAEAHGFYDPYSFRRPPREKKN